MFKLVKFFSVFLLPGLFFIANMPSAGAATTDQLVSASLPAELTAKLSADGNTLINGLPLKAVVDDPNPSTLRHIPAPAALLAEPSAASATFSISYLNDGDTDPWGERCYVFPAEAKAAFNAAANIWANTLKSSVPVTISACWASLASSSTLGYSGGGPLHRDFSGATRSGTWYTGSLANALHGSDLNTSSFDMHITYNRNFTWYYGTDGNTPSTKHDLMSVVLHEIAHGLNFSGSMEYASGVGSWGYNTGYPNIYDVFIRDAAGVQLINTTTYPNGSTALGNALISNNIAFYGSRAMLANGNQRVKMYAPSTWSSGSSYSHLDYDTFNNTANQLMVYAISAGESIHDPGAITRGLLSDLGWPLSSTPGPPSSTFSWPMFLPAIITNGGGGSQPQNPQWGAGSDVCCTTSSTTFSLTASGITRKSSVASCGSAATWEGWVNTTPGSHSFSWSFSSPTCGSATNTFNYTMLAGKAYFFQLEWEDPKLVVYVYTSAASSSNLIEKENQLTAAGAVSGLEDSMQLETTIQLGTLEKSLSGGSCKVSR